MPSALEKNPFMVDGSGGSPTLTEREGHYFLKMNGGDKPFSDSATRSVTTETLGKTKVSGESFENPDGTPLRIETDYLGSSRDPAKPTPGCFESLKPGINEVQVW